MFSTCSLQLVYACTMAPTVHKAWCSTACASTMHYNDSRAASSGACYWHMMPFIQAGHTQICKPCACLELRAPARKEFATCKRAFSVLKLPEFAGSAHLTVGVWCAPMNLHILVLCTHLLCTLLLHQCSRSNAQEYVKSSKQHARVQCESLLMCNHHTSLSLSA